MSEILDANDKLLADIPPLPVETHPYRPSISRDVAYLCVEPGCDCIYAKESEGYKAEQGCPRCGNSVGFRIGRVIRGINE